MEFPCKPVLQENAQVSPLFEPKQAPWLHKQCLRMHSYDAVIRFGAPNVFEGTCCVRVAVVRVLTCSPYGVTPACFAEYCSGSAAHLICQGSSVFAR